MDRTTCLICNCEGTMTLVPEAFAGLRNVVPSRVHTQLCRAQLPAFEAALATGTPLIVACTQEAPLFEEVAEGADVPVRFANIRETAGWSDEAAQAGPKMAALVARAAHDITPARGKDITSDGSCLVYGAGQAAIEAARLLSPRLSVTLLLSETEDVLLPPTLDFPVFRGKVARLQGSFGTFELSVDGYAPLHPSSRGALSFDAPRDGARSRCSLVLDMSGATPLVSGPNRRDGYVRVDPNDPTAVMRAIFDLSDMVGTFEKPIYVAYQAESCAHSRSTITGCSNCLDVCPAGAIAPDGDGIAVDAGICGGCGACAAACPTGAITYQYPMRADRLRQAQAMLAAFEAAGGEDPILVIHDAAGEALIAAMARFGRGLPARVIPWAQHSATGIGHVELCALVASGAAGVIILAGPTQADDIPALARECTLAETILTGLSAGAGRMRIVEEADPDRVEAVLWSLDLPAARPARRIGDHGNIRDLARTAFAALAPDAVQGQIDLPTGAPYGAVGIATDKCTLCMACASACPTGAMMDTPGEPHLRFAETACVQCGICVATCPETALHLTPRLKLTSDALQPVTLHQEAPFDCVECGKPFATRSTIARIKDALAGKHAMYADAERARLIEMCDICRVEAQANSANDPFSMGPRRVVRTTEDYLAGQVDDYLIED